MSQESIGSAGRIMVMALSSPALARQHSAPARRIPLLRSCPKPWQTTQCAIDLRPGGLFTSVRRGPEGQEFTNSGCYLEIVENERRVFTDALLDGFRPSPNPFFTAVLDLTALGPERTRYVATAIHGNEEARTKHEQMGFYDGWGTVVTQMVAYIK